MCSRSHMMTWEERVEWFLKIVSIVLGLGFIASGLYLIWAGKCVDDALFRYGSFIIPEEFVNTARTSIILGVSLVIVIALQIFGSVREWSFFMLLNASLLAYLCIIGFLVINYAKEDAGQLEPQLYYGLLVSLKRFGEDSVLGGQFRKGWTSLQVTLNCCGVHNYTEWKGVKTRYKYDPQLPISCCKNRVAFCSDTVDFENATQASEFIFVEGCYEKAKADIPFHRIWEGVIPFEVVGILSTLNCAFLSWRWRNLSA